MPKISSLTVLAALLLQILHVTYAQMDITELGENRLLTDLYLDERENRHFMMQVTDRNYVSGQHLTITAFATSFGSDPDIYISNVIFCALSNFCFRVYGLPMLVKPLGTALGPAVIPVSSLQVNLHWAIISISLLCVVRSAPTT